MSSPGYGDGVEGSGDSARGVEVSPPRAVVTGGASGSLGVTDPGLEGSHSSLHVRIEQLKKAQADARTAKAKATKDLRNAVKKKSRVMKKARELTNKDLAEVITMRQEAAAQRASRKAGGATSAAGPGQPAPMDASSPRLDESVA